MQSPIVVIDHRERGEVRASFSRLPCQIQLEQLKIADYIVSSDFAIERKRGDDFARSLCDNRFFSQLARIKCHYARTAIVLEKPRLAFKRNGLYEGSILGALIYCAFKHNVPIIPTQSEMQTAQVIYSFAKREQSQMEEPFVFKPITTEEKPLGLEDQIRLVEGLWNVGNSRAKMLLRTLKTPSEIFKAIQSSQILKTSGGNVKGVTGPLSKIRGFGPSFALFNKRLLELPFRVSKQLPIAHLTKK